MRWVLMLMSCAPVLLILNPSLDDGLAEAFQPRADLGSDGVSFFYVACAFRCDLLASGVERSDDVLAGVAWVQADLSLKSGWGSDVDAGFGGHVIYSVSSLLMHPLTAGLRVGQHLFALFCILFLSAPFTPLRHHVAPRCSSRNAPSCTKGWGCIPKGIPPSGANGAGANGLRDAGSETFTP